jgi:excisionase family DNA binding protein
LSASGGFVTNYPGRRPVHEVSATEISIPHLLTVEATAQALTVSKVTVRTWIREKKLTKVKLGRRVAVTAESVANLINQGLSS